MSTAPWSAFGETLGEGGASAKYGLAAVPVRSRQALESGFCVGADPQMAPNRMTRRGNTNNRESTDNHAGERRLRGYHTRSDRYCIVASNPLVARTAIRPGRSRSQGQAGSRHALDGVY